MKKSISVSNLTLDLYLDYVKPAARAAGILEEVPARDDWHEFTAEVTEETAAAEIAHCMTVACFNAHQGDNYGSEAEARQMLYQMEVSMEYRPEAAEIIKALYDAMTAMLTTAPAEEQTTETTETEEMKEEETMFNSYIAAVTEDAAQYIRDNYTAEEIAEAMTDRDEFAEKLNDEMWIADEVTGNGSGSYTFNRMKAREYVLNDIDTVREALREFGTEADTIAEKFLDEEWEYFDVTARCYVLGQAINAALDIIEAETKAA